MSTLQLEETLRGGGLYRNRNLDVTLETLVDLSDYQYRPVYIDTDGTAITSGIIFAGILQNKGEDSIANIRYAGVSRVILGELPGGSGSIDAGQLLALYDADGVAVPFDAIGSTKESFLVRVTDSATGEGITGYANDLEVRAYCFSTTPSSTINEFDLGSTFANEINAGYSPGWYEIGLDDGQVFEFGTPHFLEVRAPSNPEYIVTPNHYSWRSRFVFGDRIVSDGYNMILGVSLESGVTDDAVLCRLFPQFF